MNSRVAVLAAVILCLAPASRAETADDRYVQIYSWIEQGDGLLKEGQTRLAVERYREALAALKELQKSHPGWNPKILGFRLEDLTTKLGQLGQNASPKAVPAFPPEKAAAPGPGPETSAGGGQEAQQRVAWLTRQNALLEAKLKEALAVQPAMTDPRELAKAEEKIRQLQKENELLTVTVEQEHARTPRPDAPTVDRWKQAEEKNKQLEAQLEAALASSKAAQTVKKDALDERDDLAKKLEKTAKQLEKANEDLRHRAHKASSRNSQELEKQLELAQAKLAVYEAQAVPLTSEEEALLKQPAMKLTTAAVPDPPNSPTNGAPARRRLTLPPGAGALFADAERAIDAGRFAEAENKLRDILRQDENNVRILWKLSGVLMDQNKTAEAEKMLNQALAVDGEDPAALYLMGSLKLREEKYDEALDLLSRSAKAEPDMPKTQYYLGRALFQKGQRAAAEAALRKAIQLSPSMGEPHYLLAVIYGTQEPLYRELARFHYKKAIAGGASRNLELEARIENGSPPAKP